MEEGGGRGGRAEDGAREGGGGGHCVDVDGDDAEGEVVGVRSGGHGAVDEHHLGREGDGM